MENLIELSTVLIIGKPLWMWVLFLSMVLGLLAFDLGVLHRKNQEISIKASLQMSAFYIAIAVIFGGWIWLYLGPQSGKEFLTGFIVEKTLALDNVFIISLVFSYLAIPNKYQHRVLFWGILGVIILRGLMIGLGASLVSSFSWVLYLFAVFLIFTGVKMLLMGETPPDISQNALLRFLKNNFRVTDELHGEKFIVQQKHPTSGQLLKYVTPLFIALIMIEFVDLIFAVDSVPAIFTITQDPYLVYTSNIFAILGLRSLYFALAAIIHRFQYLKPALALVLIFIGSKTFIAYFMNWKKFPASVSLGVSLTLLTGGIALSILFPNKAVTAEHK